MKRIVHLLIAVIAVLAFFSSAAYGVTLTKEYFLDDLNMKLSIPTTFHVLTKDIGENDPALEYFGLSKKDALNMMNDGGIYLSAISDPIQYEITVTVVKSEVKSLSQYSDSDLMKQKADAVAGFGNAGVSLTEYEIVTQSSEKFVRMGFSRKTNEILDIGIQYSTTHNYNTINLTIHSYNSQNEKEHQELAESVFNSIVFTDTSAKTTITNNATSSSTSQVISIFNGLTNFIVSLIITFAVYSLPILIYRFVVRKKSMEKKKAKVTAIVYGVIAFLVMSAIIYSINGSGAAGVSIFLWSWINYKILVSGKSEQEEVTKLKDLINGESDNDLNPITESITPIGVTNNDSNEEEYPETVTNHSTDTNASASTINDVEMSLDERKNVDHDHLNSDSTVLETLSTPVEKQGDGNQLPDTLFCRKCGAKIPNDSVFCNRCGTKVLF